MIKDRAETLEQKVEVIHRLLYLWKKHPYLRLTQLICNVYAYPLGKDPYYVEDLEFIKRLEEHYEAKDSTVAALAAATQHRIQHDENRSDVQKPGIEAVRHED